MFCSKCGKEIDDSAVICTGCGCPTANYNSAANSQTNVTQQNQSAVSRTAVGSFNATQPTVYASSYTESDKIIIPKLREYISDVNTIFVLSVIGILLSLGIGIIFAGIALYKTRKLPVINTSLEDPNLIADFQKAQKKLATATMLLIITVVIFAILIFIGFFGILFNL